MTSDERLSVGGPGVPGFDDLDFDALSARSGAKWARAATDGLAPA